MTDNHLANLYAPRILRKFTELCHPRQGREAAAGDPVLIQVSPVLILDPRPSAEDDNALDLKSIPEMIQLSEFSLNSWKRSKYCHD